MCHLRSYNIIGKIRKSLNTFQKLLLTKSFQANPYLEDNEMHQYARLLNLSKERISRWYKKKRCTERQAGFLAKGEKRSDKQFITNNAIQSTVSMC